MNMLQKNTTADTTTKTIVGENDVAVFSQDGSFARDYGGGYSVCLAERKDGTMKTYILYKDGSPVYDSKKIEDIWTRMDMLKILERS